MEEPFVIGVSEVLTGLAQNYPRSASRQMGKIKAAAWVETSGDGFLTHSTSQR
jgi:hypothetical protein